MLTRAAKIRLLIGLPLGALLLAAAAVVGANLWVVRSARPHVYHDVLTIPGNDVGLLLGTSPYTRMGNESKLFRHRIAAAVELYRRGKIRHIIASGANPDESYNEPRNMYRALIAEGVPPEAITMDFAGLRTLDSVVRAAAVFQQTRFTIVSQRFHDYRAVFIARHQGMDAVAYAAPEEKDNQKTHVLIREYLARVAAVLDLFFLETRPRFLGAPVAVEVAPEPPVPTGEEGVVPEPGPRWLALADIHGEDLEGRDGPLAKVGFDLALLYREYKACSLRECEEFIPSNAGLRLSGARVMVDAVAARSTRALGVRLSALGMKRQSRYGLFISGFLPIEAIPKLAALAELKSARPSLSSGAASR